MSAWNITASADLIKAMAKLSDNGNAKNSFAAANSTGFSSDYAKILSQEIAQVEEEFNQSTENISDQEYNAANTMPVIETIKRFRPDGSIMITTYKDGKIDGTTKIKPHLVPEPDFDAPPKPDTGEPEIKLVPQLSLAQLLLL